MRVIFLDFDGVVNCKASWTRGYRVNGFRGIDPANVKTLNLLMKRIEERFGEPAKIVISSTWRNDFDLFDLKGLLVDAGFEHPTLIIDKTGIHPSDIRGLEILEWLTTHGPVDGFVILDDHTDMAHLRRWLVQTSDQHGLCYKHIDRVLKTLEISLEKIFKRDVVKDLLPGGSTAT